MNTRRAGEVVRIRVNPTDCMGVVDVVRLSGISTRNMSFSQMASLALTSLLEGARTVGAIPTRTGYEYNELVGPHLQGERTGAKLEVAQALYKQAADGRIPSFVPSPTKALEVSADADEFKSLSTSTQEERARAQELYDRKDRGEILTGVEELEFQGLMKKIFPNG